MGNRKENLKKSLGITEYPWSSDDDEDAASAPDVLQRTNREPRPSVADLPGTSGVQSQPEQASPATTRRAQARLDRHLFWSIIHSTPKPTNDSIHDPSSRPRPTGAPCPTPRNAAPSLRPRIENIHEQRSAARRTDRQNATADVQRILAFKKLTRSLQDFAQNKTNAAQRASASASVYSASRASTRPSERILPPRPAAGPGAPSRSTLFTPTLQVNRDGYNYNPPWRQRPTYSNESQAGTSAAWFARASRRYNQPTTLARFLEPPDTFDMLINSNENESYLPENQISDIPLPPQPVQKVEPADEPTENPEEENIEEPVHNESGSGARLIEEVVEVEAPDAGDNNNPPPPGTEQDEEMADPPADNNTSAGTANAEETAEAAQEGSSYHGVKRKRESDEASEIFTVQEFNQSLLRLLECPVCLEWMEPPISQCRRGHLVCSRCRARLAACPVCRTPFSSVRNRAMEGVAEMLRYPCRHGCGREVRLRRRNPHEASCGARRYVCPAPNCARQPPLPRDELARHFQCSHLNILKIGSKHKFSMKVNTESHDTWLLLALDEYFHLRVDVDIRTWGVVVYVAYIGPKKDAKRYTYIVTVQGLHNSRKLVYTRSTHSDLESSTVNVSRQDCFHLTLDQALNFLRFKNRHCESDKFIDFDVEIVKWEPADDSKDESDT